MSLESCYCFQSSQFSLTGNPFDYNYRDVSGTGKFSGTRATTFNKGAELTF